MGHTLDRGRGGEGSYTDQVTDPGKDSVIGMGRRVVVLARVDTGRVTGVVVGT